MIPTLEIGSQGYDLSAGQRPYDLMMDIGEWFDVDVHSTTTGQSYLPGVFFCYTVMELPGAATGKYFLGYLKHGTFYATSTD
jgi:hypothetical protein